MRPYRCDRQFSGRLGGLHAADDRLGPFQACSRLCLVVLRRSAVQRLLPHHTTRRHRHTLPQRWGLSRLKSFRGNPIQTVMVTVKQLLRAAGRGDVHTVTTAVREGPFTVHTVDASEATMLHRAAEHGRTEMVSKQCILSVGVILSLWLAGTLSPCACVCVCVCVSLSLSLSFPSSHPFTLSSSLPQ